MSNTVSTRLDDETERELREYAEERDISRSQALREWIESGREFASEEAPDLAATSDLARVDELMQEAEQAIQQYEQKVNAQKSNVERMLEDHVDLANLDEDLIKTFGDNPYKILPKGEDEYYVVSPRFVPFSVGHLLEQDEAWNVFVINKYVGWIEDIPTDVREKIDLGKQFDSATVEGSELTLSDGDERDRAWDELGGTDGGLNQRKGDDKILIKQGKEFDVIAELVEGGNLPFAPNGIDEGDLRGEPEGVSLRPYQERAWAKFQQYGQVGIYWPPGLGKTFLSLYAGERVKGDKLVVVPSSTLEEQWKERIREYCQKSWEWEVKTYQYLTHRDNMQEYTDVNSPKLTVFDECLSGDTEVVTRDGRRSFADLDKEHDFDDGWTREVDMAVRTFDPEAGGYAWTDVTGVYKTESPVQTIETATGRDIRATPGHTHMILSPETGEITSQTGVEEGDYLLLPLPGAEGSPDGHAFEELIGWFIGDGHASEYDNIKFSFSRRAEQKVKVLSGLLDRLGAEYSVFDNSRGDLTLYAPKLADVIEWTGGSGNKTNHVRVPPESFTWSDGRVGALLRGLFDTDGSVGQDARIEFDTTSAGLCDDVERLLQSLGILSRRQTIDKSDASASQQYRLTIPPAFADAFAQQVGFRLEHKDNRVRATETNPDTAVRIPDVLQSLKENLNLRVHELAEWTGVERQTMGGAIRGEHGLGQQHLQQLANSLTEYAQQEDGAREAYNIPYAEVADTLGCSTGHAHTLAGRGVKRFTTAVADITQSRRAVASEYEDRLRQLSHLHAVEVTSVELSETDTVYDFETADHTFIADGVYTHNCHTLPANTFSKLATLETKYRIGLSATPYREDDRTDYIFALTGVPVGIQWEELLEYSDFDYPEVTVYLYRTPAKKKEDLRRLVREGAGKTLIFCDSIDAGEQLSDELGVPFVHGETPKGERMDLFRDHNVVIGSRVADEGLSLDDLDRVIEYDFHGGSRRQELQRAGRVMHSDSIGQHIVQMTDEEHEKYGRRLYSLEEKGMDIRLERRS